MICDLWGFTCESSCESVCENNAWITSMWNSRCFAIQWGLNTCESPCEVRIYMWKLVRNSMWKVCENMCERVDITSHPFHMYFTMQNVTRIWNMCVKCMWKVCEKRVKGVWKGCENKRIFTRFSPDISHTYS